MGGLFKSPKAPVIPEPPPVAKMADPNDMEIELAQRRDLMKRKAETGKQSTVLADADQAGDYKSTILGA